METTTTESLRARALAAVSEINRRRSEERSADCEKFMGRIAALFGIATIPKATEHGLEAEVDGVTFIWSGKAYPHALYHPVCAGQIFLKSTCPKCGRDFAQGPIYGLQDLGTYLSGIRPRSHGVCPTAEPGTPEQRLTRALRDLISEELDQ
ncbi:MAG TPA: hypothetical protein VEH27_00875 [Methylomirabilota bacterium]|nr:hypothetical protein [Methylomirabilota bacterium]